MEDILHQLRLVVNQSHYFENFLKSQVVQDFSHVLNQMIFSST